VGVTTPSVYTWGQVSSPPPDLQLKTPEHPAADCLNTSRQDALVLGQKQLMLLSADLQLGLQLLTLLVRDSSLTMCSRMSTSTLSLLLRFCRAEFSFIRTWVCSDSSFS
ncbi:hypothetical protein INR49_003300, partial [Caranx melampygus]